MYEVELSEAAVTDLDDFSDEQKQEIFSVLIGFEENPKPEGIEVMQMDEAADYLAYHYQTATYSIFYNIFETARVVKVVAIFKRISLN